MDDKVSRSAAHARIVISDLVPDGKTMIEVECPGETVIAVHPDHISPELAREWNAHLAHATRSGRWLRAETPPEQPKDHPPT